MKNVLFLGPYKDTNSLGYSSRRYLDALTNNSNINLCIRPFFFTKSSISNPINLSKLEKYQNNTLPYYDYVIQHGFPEMFVYDKRFGKNIGVVEVETRNIQASGWINRLNLMDEVWINSINGLNSINDAGCTSAIKLVPEPYEMNIYNQTYEPFYKDLKQDNRPFIFYTIGSYTEQKNIKGIILAYLLEFNNRDNVKLLVKTNSYSIELSKLDELINFDIYQIKRSLRKKDYPDINIISGYVCDTDIIRLHQSSDCYVNAVRADGMGPSAIEAMISNKIVINTKNVGSSTYFHSGNALMVDSIETNVFSPESLNENIFTINEMWDEPNIYHLQQQMRTAYNMSIEQKQNIIHNYNTNIFHQNILEII